MFSVRNFVFKGVCTALVTPFDADGRIDYVATKRLLDKQVEGGVSAILVLGSTGEGASLLPSEKCEFVAFVRHNLPPNIKLVVGCGSNKVEEVVASIAQAKVLGADCCLVQTPFFVRCTQQGILQFFNAVCAQAQLPILIYNVPSRSGVNVEPETMLKLCKQKNVCGIKEANGNINHILKMFNKLAGKMPIYCGNDNLTFLFFCLGATGTISVASNLFPRAMCAAFSGQNSLKICNQFFKFFNLLFCQPNPIPIKFALNCAGLVGNNLRLPLTPLNSNAQALKHQVQALGAWL